MKQRNRLDWMLAIAIVERFRATQRLLVRVGSIPTWVILPLCICGGSYNLFTTANTSKFKFQIPVKGVSKRLSRECGKGTRGAPVKGVSSFHLGLNCGGCARVKGVSSGAEWAFGVGCVPLALISAGFGGFVFCAYFLSRPS